MMRFDSTLVVDSLDEVTRELVMQGIERAMGYGNTSDNLIFPNGDDVYIYGTEVDAPNFFCDGTYRTMWASISFRNYCGTCELLVKDSKGDHIIYNKIVGLSKDALADEYYHEICLVKHMIDGVAENAFEEVERSMYRVSAEKLLSKAADEFAKAHATT